MRVIAELGDNRPLQLLVRTGVISVGGTLAALFIGFFGFAVFGHHQKATWADASYSYTSTTGRSTVTVTYSGNTVPAAATPASPTAPVSNTVAATKLGLSDPPADIPPPTDFQHACYTTAQSQACDNIALANINQARASEGLGAMVLPDYYASLPLDQQIVVVTNLERTSRGLAAAKGPDQLLNPLAQTGALHNADPAGPADFSWASNWSGGVASALAADYSWMYDDGPGSNNVDCSASTPSGCWGHRHNILVTWPNVSMGVGIANVGGWVSLSQLFVENW